MKKIIIFSFIMIFSIGFLTQAVEYEYGEYLGEAIVDSSLKASVGEVEVLNKMNNGGKALIVDLSSFKEEEYLRIVVEDGDVERVSYSVYTDDKGWSSLFAKGFKAKKIGEWENITKIENLKSLADGNLSKVAFAINYDDRNGYKSGNATASLYVGKKNVREKLNIREIDISPGERIKLGILQSDGSGTQEAKLLGGNYITISTENLNYYDKLIFNNFSGEIDNINIEAITIYDDGSDYIRDISNYIQKISEDDNEIIYNLRYESIYEEHNPIRLSINSISRKGFKPLKGQLEVYLEGGGVASLYQEKEFNYEVITDGYIFDAAIDKNGYSHLIIRKDSGVYYYNNMQDKWDEEKILNISSMDIVSKMKIKIDDNAKPHIAFINENNNFYYITKEGAEWKSYKNTFYNFNLAVDKDSNVHIIADDNKKLYYLNGKNSNLKKINLNIQRNNNVINDLIIDENGVINTLYVDNSNKKLYYIKIDNFNVNKEVIYDIPEDKAGFVNVSITHPESQKQIKQGKKSTENDEYTTEFYINDISLLIDNSGNKHIAYQFYRNRQSPGARAQESSLNYLSNKEGEWENEFIDAGQTMLLYGAKPTIWEDDKGKINIIANNAGDEIGYYMSENNKWNKKIIEVNQHVDVIDKIFNKNNNLLLYRDYYQYTDEDGLYLIVGNNKYKIDTKSDKIGVLKAYNNRMHIFYVRYDQQKLKNVIRHAWREKPEIDKSKVSDNETITYNIANKIGDIKINNNNNVKNLNSVDVLVDNDIITTEADSFLEIRVTAANYDNNKDYLSLQLWPESKLRIDGENIVVEDGFLRVIDKNENSEQNSFLTEIFSLSTPVASLNNLENDYIIFVDIDGSSMFFINRGKLNIQSLESNKKVELNEGESVVVISDGGYIDEIEKMTEDQRTLFDIDVSDF